MWYYSIISHTSSRLYSTILTCPSFHKYLILVSSLVHFCALFNHRSLVLEKDNRIHSELQWTADEKHLLFHPSGASEIHIYNGRAPAKVVSKITVHRLRSYKVSPLGKDGVTSHIAVFSLAKGNQEPAAVHVFDLAKPARARTMLPFGGAEEATLMWNSLGSAVLIKTLTHDTGGASYYGQTRLYMLLADGSAEYNVTLGTGAVLDVAWAPRTYDFITLIGEARCAKATVWSAKNCQPTKVRRLLSSKRAYRFIVISTCYVNWFFQCFS